MKLRMIVLQARSQVPTLTELFQWMDQWEWKEQLEMGHDNFSIEVTGPYTSPVTDDPQRGRRNYFLVYEPGMWTARSVFTLLFHTPWSRVLLEKLTGSQLDKKFPEFYGTRKFITAVTSACQQSLPCARSAVHVSPSHFLKLTFQVPNVKSIFHCLFCTKELFQVPNFVKCFVTLLSFYGEELLAPRPTPKLEDHPLSAVCDCLFSIFVATLHIWRPFLHPQPEDAPWCGARDPHIVVCGWAFLIKQISSIWVSCKADISVDRRIQHDSSHLSVIPCRCRFRRIVVHLLSEAVEEE